MFCILVVFLLSIELTRCNLSLQELYSRGFKLPSTASQQQHSTKPPKHLSYLIHNRSWNNHRNGVVNRVVCVMPKSLTRSERKQEVSFLLPKVQGEIRGLQIYIPTRNKFYEAEINIENDVNLQKSVHAVQDMTVIELDGTLYGGQKRFNFILTVHSVIKYSDGSIADILKPVKDVLDLKRNIFINIFIHHDEINSPESISYRHEVIARFHQNRLQKRSSQKKCFCSKRNLMVNFHNLGYANIIAPIEYNAFYCSGQCHLSHEASHMTNHAFIKNLLFFSGASVRGAVCVPETTSSISVIVQHGTDFIITEYTDMKVETCSCR